MDDSLTNSPDADTPALRLGVDLGGTKTEGIVMDRDNRVVARRRYPTPAHSYDAIVAAIAALVTELEDEVDSRCPVGLGMPGSLSPLTGRVRNANTVCLNDQPFADDLAVALGREVALANDANCFALSEARDGAGAGSLTVFGVILGTGVGGGLVVDGAVLSGRNGVAGEWGHNALPWSADAELPGPACYCGRSGCIETWLSGPGLAADYAAAGGEAATARDIAGRAADDRLAASALERHQHRLARALAAVINIVDPDVIVLGGGLSAIPSLYQRVPELWKPFVFADHVDTPLRPARFGAASGVRGAAWLAAANC